LRTFGSRLEGHPKPLQDTGDRGTPRGLPWVDVATGSLGQGLPVGIGMTFSGKYATSCLPVSFSSALPQALGEVVSTHGAFPIPGSKCASRPGF
jgi:hypothetical protein